MTLSGTHCNYHHPLMIEKSIKFHNYIIIYQALEIKDNYARELNGFGKLYTMGLYNSK